MTGKIFINYRRGDDPGHTGRLFDRLQDVFDPQQLFLDVDNIAPGLDFVRVLNERVAECDIVLAVIGKGWIDARDGNGNRRLDDPDDFVRIEITSALNQGKRVIPVLVGEAQMPRPEDLPEALQSLARRNAVRLTHERFRADTQGLIKAIQQGLQDIEAERQAQAEAERKRQEAAERKRQEDEAARRLAEEERAAAERRRHAEDERAFTGAKHAGTVAALDAFLGEHGESSFADEARNLREVLVARGEAFRQSAVSNDPVVLRSFIETYKKGADVRSVRTRLHHIEPAQARLPIARSATVAALGLILIAGGSLYWLKFRPAAESFQPASVVTNDAPTPTAKPTGGTVTEANSKVAPIRAVDQVAWDLVKETTDENALRRFVEQYPDSALRQDAENRIASLEAAEAARLEAAAKAEAARAEAAAKAEAARQAEIAARIAAANKAVEEERAKAAAQAQQSANQQLAAVAQPGAAPGGETALNGAALVQAIKMELTRVGCYAGKLDGDWTSPSVKQSIMKFVKAASLPRVPDDPSADFLSAVRDAPSRICPLECARTEIAANGKCIAKTCPSGQSLDDNGNCIGGKQRAVSHSAPGTQPAVSGRSTPADTAPQGRGSHGAASPAAISNGDVGIICGRFGCKSKPARPAPGGLPCAKAIQDRNGAWRCT